MVEVMTALISNRVDEFIRSRNESGPILLKESKDVYASESLPLVSKLSKDRARQEQLRKREFLKKEHDKLLFSIKEKEWGVFLAKKSRPLSGLSCSACVPQSRDSLYSEEYKSSMVQNVLALRNPPHNCSLFAYFFSHISSLCKLKRYHYPPVFDAVLNNERIKEAIELSAKEALSDINELEEKKLSSLMKQNAERAAKILKGMRATLSDTIFKIVGWLVYKVLSQALMSIAVHPCQIKMLQSAKERGLPIVYLPLHRSHLDYTTISLTLQCLDFRSPIIASGDNLKIPVFEWALRSIGAFYIKRRIDPVEGKKDILYRSVLYTYMTECLKAGYDIEFFIEGGRSRTGKPAIPKGGLLSIIVDAYINGTIEDALLVPISANYERLVDGNFIREQLGEPKKPETFWGAMSAIYKTLTSRYGMMRIDFNQPFSLKELVKSFEKRLNYSNKTLHVLPSSTSFHGTGYATEEQRQLVNSIATHIVYDSCQAMTVMSTNAVSFLLLNKFRSGVSKQKLVEEVDKLRKALAWSNKDVGFTGQSIDVINHACRILGPGLVHEEKTKDGTDVILSPVVTLPNVIELSYYSNALVPHFILDGIVATALYSLLRTDIENLQPNQLADSKLSVKQIDLLKYCLKICDILQYDFIFTKPCQYLDSVVIQAIERFTSFDILAEKQELLTEEEQWSRRFARALEEENDDYDDYCYSDEFNDDSDSCVNTSKNSGPTYEVNLDPKSMETLESLRNLVQPYIDTFSVSAKCLEKLVNTQIQEQTFILTIVEEIKSQLSQGFLKFNESVAVDPIKNSLKLFERWFVLECFTQDKIKLLYLNDEYDSEVELKSIIERITCFR